MWIVIRHSSANSLAQAVSTSWSDIGYHGRAHFGAASANAAVQIAAGERTDYSCVQQVYSSLRLGPVTAVAANISMGIIVAGLATGAVAIVSSRDGRLHRIVPYSTPLLFGAPHTPTLEIQTASGSHIPVGDGSSSWLQDVSKVRLSTTRPTNQIPLPATKHVMILPSGYVLVHWARHQDPESIGQSNTGSDILSEDMTASATTTNPGQVASELGLIHINGTVHQHVRLVGTPTAEDVAAEPVPSSPVSTPRGGGVTRGRTRLQAHSFVTLPSVTSFEATPDGTVLIIGTSTGEIALLNGLTLRVLGRIRVHQETSEAIAAAQRAADSALAVATFAAAAAAANAAAAAANEKPKSAPSNSYAPANVSAGLRASFASAFGVRRAISKAASRSSETITDDTGSSENPVKPTLLQSSLGATTGIAAPRPPAPLSESGNGGAIGSGSARSFLHPSVAITSLRFTDDHRTLLVGCGDGRLCVVTDMVIAQRTLTSTLQSGLFGLV